VVKPISNTGGTGISTDVTTVALLKKSFAEARDLSNTKNANRQAIVQQHISGEDYRVLVIDQTQMYAIQRIPAHVVGDGRHSITELTISWNKTRKSVNHIKLEDTARRLLKQQGMTLSSIPATDKHVRLAGVANFHAGGTLRDATDLIGPTVKKMALDVAQYFNLPLVGIDFISNDIANDPGVIIELNSTPDLTIHHTPDHGQSRDVTAAIIDMLFPETI